MNQLDLLLARADDRRPVLPQGLPDTRGPAKYEPEKQERLGNDIANQNDLQEQRWAVIVPEGAEGLRLRALIEPLITARKQAQGDREVKVYTSPAKLDTAQAITWRKQVLDTGKDTTQDRPRYQLILGDLDQVPLALQQSLQAAGNYVGRLAFADDQGYLAYVDKLLRWEKQPSVTPQARSLLFTVHDQTMATDSGYQRLMSPGLELARKRQAAGEFNAREIVELGDSLIPDPDELLRETRKPDPALLFTLSHGLGAPNGGWKSMNEQRLLQGAMSFGRQGLIAAEQVGQQPFLPGGIWFMFACYGAGTPETSVYQKWLSELAQVGQFGNLPQSVLGNLPKSGDRPFIAALPQAVLRNDNGPLAFIGHIDLAWTYSFLERDSGKADPKPGRFMDILRYLLAGDRVGAALQSLLRYIGQVDTELGFVYGRDGNERPADPAVTAKRGHLWMLRHDLAGYMLLGDPAARLPLPTRTLGPAEPRVATRPVTLGSVVGSTPAAAPTAAAAASGVAPATGTPAANPPPKLPKDIVELEAIFARLLTPNGGTLRDIAADYQLSYAQLQQLFNLYRQAGRRALGVE